MKKRGLLKHREMSPKVLNRLEQEVFPHLKRLQFGGNNFGEQLLASNWNRIFEEVSRKDISISTVTNGTLLNSERIQAMVEAGVEFNFSLEGIHKESYQAIRGYEFDKFFSLINETCQEKLKKPQCGARVNLGYTIFRDNILEIIDLIKTSADLGIDRIVVTHLIPWQESQRQQSLVYHKELSNRMLAKAKKLAQELDICIDLPKPFILDCDRDKPQSNEKTDLKACYHPWRSCSVNEKGDVMPCCASSVVMGNLEKSSFSEIWNGRKFRRLRKTVNSSHPLVFCRDCVFREIDIESSEPVSFWSDDKILLAGIGTEVDKKSSFQVTRRLKNRLLETQWARTLLPYLSELYRQHAAFYFLDIYDRLLAPLTKRFKRSYSIRDHYDK